MMCALTLSLSVLLAIAAVQADYYEDHSPRQYKFAYGVKDPHTGDHHEQKEVNDGHVVRGSYSLKEADGTTRVVDYVAGPHSGFNAVVRRLGHAHHPQDYWKNSGNQRSQEGHGYGDGSFEGNLGRSLSGLDGGDRDGYNGQGLENGGVLDNEGVEARSNGLYGVFKRQT